MMQEGKLRIFKELVIHTQGDPNQGWLIQMAITLLALCW